MSKRPYIFRVFKNPPECVDPNQEFLGYAASALEDRGYQVSLINTVGFPAAAVDLGWLLHRIKEAWAAKNFDNDEELVQIVRTELLRVVTRVKRLRVWRTKNRLNLDFSTEDDSTWYDYKFSVYLPGMEPKEEPFVLEKCDNQSFVYCLASTLCTPL